MNAARAVLLFGLLLCLLLPAGAQVLSTPSVSEAPAPPVADTPAPPVADTPAPPVADTPAPLFVTPAERRYFALGLNLSRAAFAHAAVTRRAALLSHIRNASAKVDGLAALAPDAAAARVRATDALAHAAALLPDLSAPADVSGPITRLSTQMAKPLVLTGDAAAIATLNGDAARSLAALTEARQLSDVLNLPALQAWLKSPDVDKNGPVWYAEGVLAGIAEAADAQAMPNLLPPAAELATDLRGLRDWLSGRLPEVPTPEQAALQDALSQFLQNTTAKGQSAAVSAAQLHALGDISRMLQAQMLSPAQAVAAQ